MKSVSQNIVYVSVEEEFRVIMNLTCKNRITTDDMRVGSLERLVWFLNECLKGDRLL